MCFCSWVYVFGCGRFEVVICSFVLAEVLCRWVCVVVGLVG